MGPFTWGKNKPSKACRQIYCHWIFCHGSKSLKIHHEQIMLRDRPAHILSLLCKHHSANWHYCTNQATRTKSGTAVWNKPRPSSQGHYPPHPRYLALYWKCKERLWGARGGGVEGRSGVTIHFLVRPAPAGAPCPARSRKPSLEMCWLTAAWFLALGSGFFSLLKTLLLFPASEGPLLSPFSTQKSKEKLEVPWVPRRHYILQSLFPFAKSGLEGENILFSINERMVKATPDWKKWSTEGTVLHHRKVRFISCSSRCSLAGFWWIRCKFSKPSYSF